MYEKIWYNALVTKLRPKCVDEKELSATVKNESGYGHQSGLMGYKCYLKDNVAENVVYGIQIQSGQFRLYVEPKPKKKGVKEEYAYGYTGKQEVFFAPETGIYKLETWGASGAYTYNWGCYMSSCEAYNRGGLGGYASGTISITAEMLLLDTMVHIMVVVLVQEVSVDGQQVLVVVLQIFRYQLKIILGIMIMALLHLEEVLHLIHKD